MNKKIKRLLYVSIITFLLVMAKNITVQAASASLTPSSLEPYEGDTVTVKADVTAGAWNLQFEGAGKTETIYGYTQSNANASDSKTITFTAGSVGTTYNFKLTGDMTDITASTSESVNKSITITVKAKPVTPPTNNDNPGTTTTEKSKEARLKTFGITPKEYDFSGFSKDRNKENWSVEVPNSVTKVNVYGTPYDSKATVKGTGDVTLKEGVNTVKVTVTAQAGNAKTYTLTITRKTAEETTTDENEGSEARLKNLGITPKEYDFSGFKKDTTSYTHEVPNDVEEIEVYAEAVDSKATIKGTGKVTLQEGVNSIVVQVTSADGKTTETYTLEITRAAGEKVTDETEETDDDTKTIGLATLQITGITLSPKFDAETYEYKVDLTEDLTTLDIVAKSNIQDATVEIIGNENLKIGENTITILVANTETEEVATYQIVVNKNITEQVVAKVDWLKPSTWGVREIILVVAAVVLLIVIIVAIVLKVRLSRTGKNEVELPGAEELDRALAEHQELTVEEEDLSARSENVDFRQENNEYNEDAIQYTKPKRKGKHF